MNDFYSEIEEPIRELVRGLRDNGINTTCSCGHKMYIEADITLDGVLQTIDRVLFNYLTEHDMDSKYSITITRERNIVGVTRCWAHIQIGETKQLLLQNQK